MDSESGNRRRARRRGLSHVETLVLCVALLLVGTAAVIASRDDGRPLQVAVLRTCELVSRARDLAADFRTPQFVVFDPARERIGVVDQDGAAVIDPITRNALLVELANPGRPAVDLVSADFGVTDASVAFDAHGLPLTAGRIVLAHGDERVVLVLDLGADALRVLE
ncbi:MAG: hypothetical protein H6825_01795 [Planctomycetes bacterium]|nr:hypothetical protein [Planctomycetota bacterium]